MLPPVDTDDQAAISHVANISVKTGERYEVRGDPGSPHRHVVRVPTVEVWIGGKRFIHDCATDEEAQEMVFHTAIDLGLSK